MVKNEPEVETKPLEKPAVVEEKGPAETAPPLPQTEWISIPQNNKKNGAKCAAENL